MNGDLWGVALEAEDGSGKAQIETEFVAYGKLDDLQQLLKAATVEHQDQWEIRLPKTDRNAAGGRMRVRKTMNAQGEIAYRFCNKITAGKGNSQIEVILEATLDSFEQFKRMAEKGMIKERFTFPVEGRSRADGSPLTWEVDLFYKPEVVKQANFPDVVAANRKQMDFSLFHDWVKLDLELDSMDEAIPAFPIEMSEIIDKQTGQRSPEEETKLRNLYDLCFMVSNVYLGRE